MANIDETPIYLNFQNDCVNNWIKEINIRTQGQENWRITIILAILASRKKTYTFFILKAKEGKDTELKLLENRVCRLKKMIFCILTKNTWNNENIMFKWVAEIWRKYLFFNLKWITLLVLDNATTHKQVKLRIRYRNVKLHYQ